MKEELRSEPREQIALPLSGDGGVGGATRDISASGLYFELNSDAPIGNEVNVTVELTVAGRAFALNCQGKVVRIEQHAGRTGMAIRIRACRLAADN
ncbi:PilZ domain-containing protein [Azoarcus sp. KH32C]|uniref:PilZ domain-containing protein n=1 Tax=Azoarcus sp. KH32C TaxID=748247 RepID=UPI0002386FFA|nr:PilZ domain-containing protein [Azoarcus sp. KH32C]BAL24469.1 hypothetical protein AZKH_2158 [Azoarcus sp. KH32C]